MNKLTTVENERYFRLEFAGWKCPESSIRKKVRAAGFVLKVVNVEMDMRGLIKTRVGWLRFTDSRVHKRVVDLLKGGPFEFNGETRAIRLKINDRQPNEFHSLTLDPVSTSHTGKMCASYNINSTWLTSISRSSTGIKSFQNYANSLKVHRPP